MPVHALPPAFSAGRLQRNHFIRMGNFIAIVGDPQHGDIFSVA
jgi:hypothetical protein